MDVKKLYNKPDHVVDEMIEGLVRSSSLLRRLQGHRVIVHANYEALRDKQVTIISGGGSGHEPAHAGYVGDGLLTAAVLGNVFASPPDTDVLAAIRAVCGPHGCLLIVKNYTGDRLNFGLAAEMARAEGLKVEIVIVGDDCALAEGIPKRGLAGTLFVHKIAGAAAATGATLEQVHKEALDASQAVATMGVALDCCTLPGNKKNQRLVGNKMEWGLGIHGEEGIRTSEVPPADDIMEEIVSQLRRSGRLSLQAGDRLAIIVNNLGTTTTMELYISARKAIAALEGEAGCTVVRTMVGSFMTSLDMSGISLSVLKLNDQRLARLDAPTKSNAWPIAIQTGPWQEPLVLEASKAAVAPTVKSGTPSHSSRMKSLIRAACEELVAREEELNELDRKVGDGDCGTTLALGARAMLKDLESLQESSTGQSIGSLAESCRAMGGSSGVLVAILMRAMANQLSQETEDTALAVAKALRTGLGAGAKVGDRTMLDSLIPGTDKLILALEAEKPTIEALRVAAIEARAGAERTKSMAARAGRAVYLQEDSIRGIPDPGAVAAASCLEAMHRVFKEAELRRAS